MEKTNTKRCTNCGKEYEIKKIEFKGLVIETGKCQCQIEKEERERQEAIKRGYERIKHNVFTESGISKKYSNTSLNNFIPHEKQKDGYNKATQFLMNQSVMNNIKGFGLFGNVGSGKTYIVTGLVNDMCNAIIESTTEEDRINADKGQYSMRQPVRFISNIELVENLKFDSDSSTIRKYKNVKLLIIDDLGSARATEWAKERLLEIIDYRYNNELTTIFTTNLTAEELSKVDNRVYDRLKEMCEFISVTAPSQRSNAAKNNKVS